MRRFFNILEYIEQFSTDFVFTAKNDDLQPLSNAGTPTNGDDIINAGFLTTSLDGFDGIDHLVLDYSGSHNGVSATGVRLVLNVDSSHGSYIEYVYYQNASSGTSNYSFQIDNFESYDITGSSGTDLIHTESNGGDDTVRGLDGNDDIRTYDGNDTIYGGAGNDNIDAGVGADVIVLGQGGGQDTIVNFEVGVDKINVAEFSEFDVQLALDDYQLGETTTMELSSDTRLIFSGIDIQTLSMSDFDFDPLPSNKATPSDFLLEYFARRVAYEDGLIFNNGNVALTDYRVEKTFTTVNGFAAWGLVSDTQAPVLLIRGTNSILDALDDLHPEEIGRAQFYSIWSESGTDSLQTWLQTHSSDGITIVGHSLGGAQSQLVATYASIEQINIAQVITYNSPGISLETSNLADYGYIGRVFHNISSGDIVSMAGESYLEGWVSVYDFDTFNDNDQLYTSIFNHAANAHGNHWTDVDLYSSEYHTIGQLDIPDRSLELVERGIIHSSELSLSSYSHLGSNLWADQEYFGLLIAASKVPGYGPDFANALLNRSNAEQFRVDFGEWLRSVPETVVRDVASAKLAFGALSLPAALLVQNWTRDTFEGVSKWDQFIWGSFADFTSEIISEIGTWGKTQWEKTINWTHNTWNAAKDWTASEWEAVKALGQDAWDAMAQYTKSHWEEFKTWNFNDFLDLLALSTANLNATIFRPTTLLRDIFNRAEPITNALIEHILGDPETVDGTTDIDDVSGDNSSQNFSLGLGDDILNPGGGYDIASLGAGADQVIGTSLDLDGSIFTDFTDEDSVTLIGIEFGSDNVNFALGSAILDVDVDNDGRVDFTIKFEGDYDLTEFVFSVIGGNTVITTVGSSKGIDQDGTELDDIINGSPGDDIIQGLEGADILDGSNGLDTLSYQNSSEGVIIDMAMGTASGGDATGDDYSNFENIIGSSFDDILQGDLADNVLSGGEGNDILNGGRGADTLNGGDGIDTASYENATGRVIADILNPTAGYIFGEAIGDTYTRIENMIGSDFNDQLRGDNDANELTSGSFSDRLYGRGGDDVLNGEGGADALYGGLGVDVMTGGIDTLRDRFIYFNDAESGVGLGNRDIITDFTSGEDRIEISRFDADSTTGGKQSFNFIGDMVFSNVAGELRYEKSGGITVVQADMDGDGLADFEIELTGEMDLIASDFLL